MATASQPSNVRVACQTCKQRLDLPLPGLTVHLSGDPIAATSVPGQQQKEELDQFFQAMNACYNEGDGEVLVHTDKMHLLNLFDDKVDNKLQDMITDDSCYADNFERLVIDKKHIVFRVIPKAGRFPSTLTANTKVSRHKGLAEPTQAQLRYLLQVCLSEHGPSDGGNTGLKLRKGEVVTDDQGNMLQESTGIQAKQISRNPRKPQRLCDHCWESLRLPDYISAFTKLPKGGSVFCGIAEEKHKGEKRWLAAAEDDFKNILELKDKHYRVWWNKNTLSVAKDVDVPTMNELKTGRLTCQGVDLASETQQSFQDQLEEKAKQEMKWISSGKRPFPVKVRFHKVEDSPTLHVVEVKVERYSGVAFYHKKGPLAYRLTDVQGPHTKIAEIETESWIKQLMNTERPLLKEQTHPFR